MTITTAQWCTAACAEFLCKCRREPVVFLIIVRIHNKSSQPRSRDHKFPMCVICTQSWCTTYVLKTGRYANPWYINLGSYPPAKVPRNNEVLWAMFAPEIVQGNQNTCNCLGLRVCMLRIEQGIWWKHFWKVGLKIKALSTSSINVCRYCLMHRFVNLK